MRYIRAFTAGARRCPIYALEDRKPSLPAAGRFWVAPNACVIGDVVLGEDCGVWFGATLRGDNERITIGARVNVQEGATLHTDMGFPLDRRRRLHDRPQCDPARLRDRRRRAHRHGRDHSQWREDRPGCLVGAGALVTEGKQFADNCLIVGSPARVVRTLDEAVVAAQRRWAAHYVDNWRRFAASLVAIG